MITGEVKKMKIVTYSENLSDFYEFAETSASDVILGHKSLSRFGKLSSGDVIELASECVKKSVRPILEWDILMTEQVFSLRKHEISKLLEHENLQVIRVQDIGAFNFILENYPNKMIQLVLENGNHNLTGLKKWCQLAGNRLDRLVLSSQLSKTVLKKYVKKLPVPVEILGLGRILLFYTPRMLLSPYVSSDMDEIEISCSSEESSHKGFPVLQNRHGTFMFNPKDLSLLDNMDQLTETGVQFLRIDTRFGLPVSNYKGFFNVNKSSTIFEKLKNERIKRQDKLFLGDVVEVNKKNHIGIMLGNSEISLNLGDQILFFTPEGKEKKTEVKTITNSDGKELSRGECGQLVFVHHISGISVRSVVCRLDE